MADSAPPPGGRKKVPMWVYLVGAAGIAGAYFLWKRSQAAAAVAAAGGSTSNAPPVVSAGGSPADVAAAIAPYLAAAGNSGTGNGSGVTITPPPQGETLQGSGYWMGRAGSSSPITSTTGQQFLWIPTAAALKPLLQEGQTIYYQPGPGIFMPASDNAGNLLTGIAPGTPLFQMVPGTQNQ